MAFSQYNPNKNNDEQGQPKQDAYGTNLTPQAKSYNVSGSDAGSSDNGNKNSYSPTSSGSKFQNLKSYLNASSGYKKGETPADQFQQMMQERQTDIQKQLQSQGDTQLGNIQSQVSQYDPVKAATWASGNPSYRVEMPKPGTYGQPKIVPIEQTVRAEDIANDPAKIAQWQNYMTANWKNAAYDPTGELAAKVNNYRSMSGNVNSESGRMALLKQMANLPGYNTAMAGLDQTLLQAQPGAIANIQNKTQAGLNALDTLNQSYQSKFGEVNVKGSQNVQKTKEALTKLLTDTIGKEEKGLQDKLETENKTGGNRFFSARDAISQGSPITDKEILDKLTSAGLVKDGRVDTMGLQNAGDLLGQYVSKTLGDIATDADRSKFNALSKLAGISKVTDAEKLSHFADKTDKEYNGFDISKLRDAVDTRRHDMSKEIKALNPSMTGDLSTDTASVNSILSKLKNEASSIPSSIYHDGGEGGSGWNESNPAYTAKQNEIATWNNILSNLNNISQKYGQSPKVTLPNKGNLGKPSIKGRG